MPVLYGKDQCSVISKPLKIRVCFSFYKFPYRFQIPCRSCKYQRAVSVIIPVVYTGSNLDKLLCQDGVSALRGYYQRRLPARSFYIKIRACLQQDPRYFNMPPVRGDYERRIIVLVNRVYVYARADEFIYLRLSAFFSGEY